MIKRGTGDFESSQNLHEPLDRRVQLVENSVHQFSLSFVLKVLTLLLLCLQTKNNH